MHGASLVVLLVVTVLSAGGAEASDEAPLFCLSPGVGSPNSTCECILENPYYVDCTNFGLRESPFSQPDTYPTPWVLKLGSNMIRDIPKIPQQDQLILLSFKMNEISSIDDSAFAALPQLRELDLSYCNLTKSVLGTHSLKGPYRHEEGDDPMLNLSTLDLSYNSLEELESHAFQHLVHLKTLLIGGNPFHDLTQDTAAAFAELEELETLDLSRAQLKRLPQLFLSSMRNLRELSLEGNWFMTVPDEVNFAKSLLALNLDRNPIKVLNADKQSWFHGAQSLTSLSLSFMPVLETIDQESLGALTNLTVLNIKHNPKLKSIHRLALGSVKGANQLKEVYLQSNSLTSLADDLLDWSALERVDLQDNPWTCDCQLKWMTKGLVQKMIHEEPELSRYIVCATPPAVMGQNIKYLLAHDYEFPCSSQQYIDSSQYYGPLIVATIFIGSLLLLTATVLCTFVLYQKSKGSGFSLQSVRYRRAREADLQPISQNELA